jgi:hypothetical protein
MGLFDFLRKKATVKATSSSTREPLPRADFARKMMDALQAAGLEGLAYNETEFSIHVAMANSRFFLGNAYAEFEAAPDDGAKERVIARFIGAYQEGLPVTPESWEEVRDSVLPLIRDRTFLSGMATRMPFEPEKQIPWQVVGEWLGLCVGHDTPRALNYVNQETLEKWGTRYETALAQALDNLAARSREPFVEIKPGCYRSPWSDCYDPERILIPEIFRSLPLKGKPVVSVPHWNALLVADSANPDALRALALITETELEQPRNNDAPLLIMEDGQWRTFLPDPSHPAHAAVLRLYKIAAVRSYGGEINDLRTHFGKTGKDIFVANLSAFQDNTTKAIISQSQLSKGVVTLLAKVDRVLLYDDSLPEAKRIIGFAPWDDLAPLLPGMARPAAGYFPPFYLVDTFPTAGQLSRIPIKPAKAK